MSRQERSAGFIAFHGSTAHPRQIAYLLLNYGHHWDFPKGHVERGENDLAAAIRELREETGIANAEVIPGFRHEIMYYFRHRQHGLIQKTVIFFLGKVPAQQVTLSDEHVGFLFLPFDEALSRVTYPSARQVLTAAHAFLTSSHST